MRKKKNIAESKGVGGTTVKLQSAASLFYPTSSPRLYPAQVERVSALGKGTALKFKPFSL